jgi:hypothetical protein
MLPNNILTWCYYFLLTSLNFDAIVLILATFLPAFGPFVSSSAVTSERAVIV